jgi:hypothetical protein
METRGSDEDTYICPIAYTGRRAQGARDYSHLLDHQAVEHRDG